MSNFVMSSHEEAIAVPVNLEYVTIITPNIDAMQNLHKYRIDFHLSNGEVCQWAFKDEQPWLDAVKALKDGFVTPIY